MRFKVNVILCSHPGLILNHLADRARYFRCGRTLLFVRLHVILGADIARSLFDIKGLGLSPVVPILSPVKIYQ